LSKNHLARNGEAYGGREHRWNGLGVHKSTNEVTVLLVGVGVDLNGGVGKFRERGIGCRKKKPGNSKNVCTNSDGGGRKERNLATSPCRYGNTRVQKKETPRLQGKAQ